MVGYRDGYVDGKLASHACLIEFAVHFAVPLLIWTQRVPMRVIVVICSRCRDVYDTCTGNYYYYGHSSGHLFSRTPTHANYMCAINKHNNNHKQTNK